MFLTFSFYFSSREKENDYSDSDIENETPDFTDAPDLDKDGFAFEDVAVDEDADDLNED